MDGHLARRRHVHLVGRVRLAWLRVRRKRAELLVGGRHDDLRRAVHGLHDVDGPRHAVPLVGLGAGDNEEGEVDDAVEWESQQRPKSVGTGAILQRKEAKGEHGPALARDHLLQRRVRGGDLGRVVIVWVVVAAVV